MSSNKESLEKQSDSVEQNDPAKALIEQRIRKKEKELQQVTLRIELLLKEGELDEKLQNAIYQETLLKGNDHNAAQVKVNYRNKKLLTSLTVNDIVLHMRTINVKLNEQEEKLVRFALRTIAEENMKGEIYDAELLIYFSSNSSMTITKGTGKQKMVICFDDDFKPVFRWEIKK